MKKSASGNVGPLDGDSLGAVCKDRLKQEVDAPWVKLLEILDQHLKARIAGQLREEAWPCPDIR